MTRIYSIALALALIAGGIAWGIMILHQGYDYDEVQRAHSIWLTSQGLRPYNDFFECHPPYFALLAPLARNQTDPGALLVTLRWVAAVGNLLFLAGLATVAAMSTSSGRLMAILGTALVAFHPAVLSFLAEFRIDGWGYALATWSIVWFLGSHRPWRYAWFGAGTGIATLLFCPKLTLLSPLILVFELVRTRGSLKDAVRALMMYAVGIGVAVLLFWSWLAANRINVSLAFVYLVRYHSLGNFRAGFGPGLLREIARLPILSLPILVAFVTWAIYSIRARSLPAVYPAALALWLVAQAALVSYPYKQYYAPWFLFASVFLVFLAPALKTLPKHAAAAVFLGLCVLSISGSAVTAHAWMNSRESQTQETILRILNTVTNPGDRVVATPPLHPILRRDTFYVWFKTFDPAGYGTEQIMEEIPLVRDLVSEQRYRLELMANPPALVVLGPDRYTRGQQSALAAFLQEHGYIKSAIGNVPVAVRPDRIDLFRQIRAPG
jgi:hypothetical protein